jgi:hypothetical protein
MVLVEVLRISYYAPSKGYAVLLQETNGKRQLPIVVGSTEAQSIALALEGVEMPRPMTHDLIQNIFSYHKSLVDKVIISKLTKGTFFARVILQSEHLGEIIIDARPSDAIAISLRSMAPIYVRASIMNKVAISEGVQYESKISTLQQHSIEDNFQLPQTPTELIENLNNALDKAISSEEYEVAAKLRDKIKVIEKKKKD